jgi:hypothetical protein
MEELDTTSGKYIGNGTSKDIRITKPWNRLTITSGDRKYIMSFFKDNSGKTIGQAAIGSGGAFKQLEIVDGGITMTETGFNIGNHISINQIDIEYYWTVI